MQYSICCVWHVKLGFCFLCSCHIGLTVQCHVQVSQSCREISYAVVHPCCILRQVPRGLYFMNIILQVIVSSAFESSIGLAQYACLAGLLDQLSDASKPASWQQQVAHGLATEGWFVPASPTPLLQPLCTCLPSASSANVGTAISKAAADEAKSHTSISLQTASDLLAKVHTSQALDLQHTVGLDRQYATFEESACRIQTSSSQYTFRVLTCCGQDGSSQKTHRSVHNSLQPDIPGSRQGHNSCSASSKSKQQRPAILFLHGFMGSADDWRPLMQALSATHHCVAVDLPGHGQTRLTGQSFASAFQQPENPLESHHVTHDVVSPGHRRAGLAQHLDA